jgi:hypothetical protein
MDLRERLETTDGLTDVSAWQNGEHWTCCAHLNSGHVAVGYGASMGAAVLCALAELGEVPSDRMSPTVRRVGERAGSNPPIC